MLNEWDEKWATKEELKVLNEHNRESGIAELSSQDTPIAA